jgi:protocatechuate 3,4-dioxygenase, alpha subunit
MSTLTATPGQTIGPFFGYALPFERGNELVPPGAPGAIRLHGVVTDGAGAPVPDALVEIWQADADGVVPTATGSLRRDGWTFTGWVAPAPTPTVITASRLSNPEPHSRIRHRSSP